MKFVTSAAFASSVFCAASSVPGYGLTLDRLSKLVFLYAGGEDDAGCNRQSTEREKNGGGAKIGSACAGGLSSEREVKADVGKSIYQDGNGFAYSSSKWKQKQVLKPRKAGPWTLCMINSRLERSSAC
jgi:hypothetical protein